jgi:hypothetical protein
MKIDEKPGKCLKIEGKNHNFMFKLSITTRKKNKSFTDFGKLKSENLGKCGKIWIFFCIFMFIISPAIRK